MESCKSNATFEPALEKTTAKPLKDTGDRTVHKSGALREDGPNKGRCDLLPLYGSYYLKKMLEDVETYNNLQTDLWGIYTDLLLVTQSPLEFDLDKNILLGRVFRELADYIYRQDAITKGTELYGVHSEGNITDTESNREANVAYLLQKLSVHYRQGAEKYKKPRNWEAGLPLESCLSSAIRHILKEIGGWRDEPHLVACAWNVLAILNEIELNPTGWDDGYVYAVRKPTDPEREKSMSRECFKEKRFSAERLSLIEVIDSVVHEYQEEGYSLTLRQLYYQLVARDIIENSERSYKNTGGLINDARLAGLLDWDAIEDRTRNLMDYYKYESVKQFIDEQYMNYSIDLWKGQESYVEVWVEKEALSNIVSRACSQYQIPYFCCRGYTSQSEMYGAAQRLKRMQLDTSRNVHIIHLGDHDPSGIDMSRDIWERLELFGVNNLGFHRVALNMNQIEQFNPPPNPAKVTDTRAKSYIKQFGTSSWELDSLSPDTVISLIHDAVLPLMDLDRFHERRSLRYAEREEIKNMAANQPLLNWLRHVGNGEFYLQAYCDYLGIDIEDVPEEVFMYDENDSTILIH